MAKGMKKMLRIVGFCFILTSSMMVLPKYSVGQEVKYIKIAQSKNEHLTNARADRIIKKMNKILTSTNFGGDQCNQLKFKRKGSVSTDDSIPEFINSKAKHDQLFNNSAYSIYVVRGISRCGSLKQDNIGGCGLRGKSVIAIDFPNDDQIAAIVWLHEFGHTQRLSHATDGKSHITRKKALMRARAAHSHQSITNGECGYLAKSSARFPTESDGASAIKVSQVALKSQDKGLEAAELRELLSQVRLGKYPIERLRALSLYQIGLLRSYLFNPDFVTMWPNVVDYLAITGTSSDVELFKSFLVLHTTTTGKTVERAKLQIPFAMGVLANRFKSQTAYRFLEQSKNPHRVQQLATSIEEQKNTEPGVCGPIHKIPGVNRRHFSSNASNDFGIKKCEPGWPV